MPFLFHPHPLSWSLSSSQAFTPLFSPCISLSFLTIFHFFHFYLSLSLFSHLSLLHLWSSQPLFNTPHYSLHMCVFMYGRGKGWGKRRMLEFSKRASPDVSKQSVLATDLFCPYREYSMGVGSAAFYTKFCLLSHLKCDPNLPEINGKIPATCLGSEMGLWERGIGGD